MIRRLLRRAGLAVTITACASLAGIAERADAGPFGDEAARVVARERLALSTATDRLGAVAESARPMARDGDITVASREEAPGGLFKQSAGKLTVTTLDALPSATGDAQWQCLAEAIYFESRGEPLAGQVAVAEVVLNRVSSRKFPGTICGVTKQGVGNGRACQFSYACDGMPEVMKSAVARERSKKLARLMIDGQPRTVAGGATYFHARAVSPRWSRTFTRTVTIGQHMFYRPATQVAGG